MNLMILVPSLKKTGPTEVVYNKIINLGGIDNIYVVQLFHDNSSDKNILRFNQIKNTKVITLFKGGKIKSFIKSRSIFSKLLKEYKPDLVHSHCLLPDFFSALYIKKTPTVSTCHNNPTEDYKMKYNYILAFVMAKIQYFSFKKITRVVSISNVMKLFLLDNNTPSNLIYNGISTEIFKQAYDASKTLKLKKKLQIEKSTGICVCIGSLISRKNVGLVLESFTKSTEKDTVLLILGDGPLKSEYENKYKDKRIKFLGHQSNVSDYLNISDLFVSLSMSEGLALNIMEASSVGLSMILTDLDQNKEQFNQDLLKDGRISFVDINKDNASDLIAKLMDDKLTRFNEEKKIKLQDDFKASTMASKYFELYKGLVNVK